MPSFITDAVKQIGLFTKQTLAILAVVVACIAYAVAALTWISFWSVFEALAALAVGLVALALFRAPTQDAANIGAAMVVALFFSGVMIIYGLLRALSAVL